MKRIRKIVLSILLLFMVFPTTAVAAEEETVNLMIPYNVSGGYQPIEIYDGENLIHSEEIFGEGNIVIPLTFKHGYYQFLLKAVEGTDENLIYSNKEYDVYAMTVYVDDKLVVEAELAEHGSTLKEAILDLEIKPKPITAQPLNLLKVDSDGNPLPGAQLMFKCEETEIIYTSSNSQQTLYLEPGEYTVSEILTPQNYVAIPTFTLVVTSDGFIVPETDFLTFNEDEILLKIEDPDKLSSVLVVHKDYDTGEVLKEIEYVCKDEKIGTPYTTHVEEFEDYEFVIVDPDGAPAEGAVKPEDQTVIYLYRKIQKPKGSVTVVHKDIDTGEVLKNIEYVAENEEIGTPYTTHTEEFEDYEFVKLDDNSAPANGEVKEEEQHVIYLYRKKTPEPEPEKKYGSVLVVYKDEDTGEVIKEVEYVIKNGEVGTPYSTIQLNFDNYIFSKLADGSAPAKGEVIEGDLLVTYLYKKKVGNVLVVYKTESGETLKDIEYVIKNGSIGTPYATNKLTFDGYEFVRMDAASAPTSGNVKEGDQTVIYIYRKIVTPAPTPTPVNPPKVNTGFGGNTWMYIAGALGSLGLLAAIILLAKKKDKK